MKAVVQTGYGPPDEVLELREVPIPDIGDDEVLVRVRAASVHPDVWHVVMGWPYVLRIMGAGLTGPRNPIPGTDVAGCIEAVGTSVTRFQPGDEVFGETMRNYQWHNGGAFAEFVAVPEDSLSLKPTNVDFEQAASVPTSGLIALWNMPKGSRDGPIRFDKRWRRRGGCRGPAAGQELRSGGDRRRPHGEAGDDAPTRCRPRHRLHEGRFHRGRREIRPDLRCSRQPPVHRLPACPQAGRKVCARRPRSLRAPRRPLAGEPWPICRVDGRIVFSSQLPISFSAPSKRESMELLKDLIESGKVQPKVARAYPLSRGGPGDRPCCRLG